MSINLDRFRDDLKRLIGQSRILYLCLLAEQKKISSQELEKYKITKLPQFKTEYDIWYSEAYAVVKQILPDRLTDFILLYRNDKRKDITYVTYTISDYLLGLQITKGERVIADGDAAIPKYEQQRNILVAANKRFESTLFDIKNIVQADLFDDELEASIMLNKKGFHRAAGAIAGVVLEKHLKQVCMSYEMQIKKRASISDYNEELKSREVIDIPTWRFIQHLSDLRNICDHAKDSEPSLEEIQDLIQGVQKIIKTIF